MGDPWPVSALHGRRTGDLLDEIVGKFPPPTGDEAADGEAAEPPLHGTPAVAIVGRPNVGKSTLFNPWRWARSWAPKRPAIFTA